MDRQVKLPRHVCFKGDNGMYLSAQVIEGYNYLQFSSGDIGDQRVRHTIYTNRDGTIRIKSDYFNKFWRRSPNWIWADSSDTTNNNPDTLFRVVKVGYRFALQNLGNNYYCTRLTTEGKESCLNASVPTINLWAYLRLEEAVLSRWIYNVQYNLNNAKIYGNKVHTLLTEEAINHGSRDNKATIDLRYSVTKERKWDSSVSMKLGVQTTFQAGVPEVASTSVQIQSEYTEAYTWGQSNSHTEEHSANYEVTVPPNTKVMISVVATEATCDVPFSYVQEDVLTTGERVVYNFDDGIYRGVNSFGFKYDVTKQKL